MKRNFVLQSDSYKYSHHLQYPQETTEVYSYFESRGGKFDKTVFFGLQYYLKDYLSGVRVTHKDIDGAKALIERHIATPNLFNEEGWRHIVDVHNGKLPLEIKAVPEGSVVPTGNVLFTIRNTDPDCYWLTNFTETLLSKIWYPVTIATNSYYIKQDLINELRNTGCNDINETVSFMLHDFGYRGVASEEQAAIGGAAHLLNFMGTDTITALTFIQDFYNTNGIFGYSIPATEHSTITSWGKERELEAYENLLNNCPSGIVACVSDSYNIYNACSEIWGTKLKEKVISRDGRLVIRPDSGDPLEVLPKILTILAEKFGYTINDKGYVLLNDKVRVIQGDGISAEVIPQILEAIKTKSELYIPNGGVLEHAGFAAENMVFGSGGGLLQKFDRDTCKFAIKCSYTKNKFGEVEVFKDPITDPGKTSKKGKLKLVKVGHHDYVTNKQEFGGKDCLETVFLNGEIVKEYTFEEVKNNSEK